MAAYDFEGFVDFLAEVEDGNLKFALPLVAEGDYEITVGGNAWSRHFKLFPEAEFAAYAGALSAALMAAGLIPGL